MGNEVSELQEERKFEITAQRQKISLNVNLVLYVLLVGKCTEIHVFDGKIYHTRIPLCQLQEVLGESFLQLHRGCLVSVRAIHDITDTVNLINGERLEYALRKKKQILEQLHSQRKQIISGLSEDGVPETEEEYRRYFSSFDNLPFAFTDIEMVFNENSRAVDWIFRYGNPALERLEKLPLERLIGSSFSSLFDNMDSKWLRSYERSALYGEILELMDYSPEIDTYLKVICFPTFRGHCGCILFQIPQIQFSRTSGDCEKLLSFYFGNLFPKSR